MAKMHLCTCFVALGGDTRNVVWRGESNAVSFPEVNILKAVHGPEAVQSVTAIDEVESDPVREKARLVAIYGGDVVERMYPGYAPMILMTMPGTTDASVAETNRQAKAKGKDVKAAVHVDAADI